MIIAAFIIQFCKTLYYLNEPAISVLTITKKKTSRKKRSTWYLTMTYFISIMLLKYCKNKLKIFTISNYNNINYKCIKH